MAKDFWVNSLSVQKKINEERSNIIIHKNHKLNTYRYLFL